MNTPEKKAKYIKRPHCCGIKNRMNEALDSKIIRLQNKLSTGETNPLSRKSKKLTDVQRVKINFQIGQAERDIVRINGGIRA
jgi:hypothetical protein